MKNSSKISLPKVLLFCIISNYAFSLKPFIISDGINMLLVATIIIVLLIGLLDFGKIVVKKSHLGLLLLSFLIISQCLFRFSIKYFISVIYSFLFICSFFAVAHYVEWHYIEVDDYVNFLKYILVCYIIVGLIQVFLFPLNIKFNMIWDSPTNRVNSLATEPSYTGIYIVITLYSYIIMNKERGGNGHVIMNSSHNILFLSLCLIIIYFTRSSYSYLFMAILLISILTRKLGILLACGLLVCVLLFGLRIGVSDEPIIRLVKLIGATRTLDVSVMAEAEHSGSIRVAPIIVYIRSLNPLSHNFWFGGGYNSAKYLLAANIPGIPVESWRGGGFIPGFVIDNGVVSFALFCWFIFDNIYNKKLRIEIVFLFLILMNVNFNTQLFWYSIITFYLNNYFMEQLGSG